MAKERIFTFRNTATKENPVWELWFAKTVCDAVMMSDDPEETRSIKDYVDEKIAELIGGAPETYDTLKEIADYIASHVDVADSLNAAIGQKADRTLATTREDGLMSKADKIKMDSMESGANRYTHPDTHPADMVAEDATHRFVTDEEKTDWNSRPTIIFGDAYPEKAPQNSIFCLVQ